MPIMNNLSTNCVSVKNWKIISTKVNKEALCADQVDEGLVAEAIEAQVKTKNQS